MHFEGFEIDVLDRGPILMDGGGVFGIIPKPLWQRLAPADERNRVRLGLNCLLIRTAEHCVLVDTGMGSRRERGFYRLYGVDGDERLPQRLAERQIAPGAVTHVVFSHLHFPSTGGGASLREAAVVPTFAQAQYVLQRAEWEEANNTNERTRGSYFDDDFKPLMDAGQLRLLEGPAEIAKGIEVILTGGHTSGHQIVVVSAGAQKIVFLGHFIPTAWHLVPHYIMAHDLYPAETLSRKKSFLDQAAAERWILVFLNNPRQPAGFLKRTETGFILEPVGL